MICKIFIVSLFVICLICGCSENNSVNSEGKTFIGIWEEEYTLTQMNGPSINYISTLEFSLDSFWLSIRNENNQIVKDNKGYCVILNDTLLLYHITTQHDTSDFTFTFNSISSDSLYFRAVLNIPGNFVGLVGYFWKDTSIPQYSTTKLSGTFIRQEI